MPEFSKLYGDLEHVRDEIRLELRKVFNRVRKAL